MQNGAKRRNVAVALIAAILTAIGASVAVAGQTVEGSDGNTQAIDVRFSPKAAPKGRYVPIRLTVTTTTGTAVAPDGVPVPAVRAVVDFDKGGRIFSKGIPTCDPARLQTLSTEAAMQVCGRAKIGSGTATVLLPVGATTYTEPVVVTAFNGTPDRGRPVVLLHAYGATPVQTAVVLVGTVSRLDREGYGYRLDVSIPPIAGGAGALTDFEVSVFKKYTYRGRKVSYVSATCLTGKVRNRGAYTFRDGVTITADSNSTCVQKG